MDRLVTAKNSFLTIFYVIPVKLFHKRTRITLFEIILQFYRLNLILPKKVKVKVKRTNEPRCEISNHKGSQIVQTRISY